MALKECKECGKEVSNKADKCPHCGVSNPTITVKDYAIGCLGMIFLIWLGWTLIFSPSTDNSSDSATTTQNWQEEVDRIAAHVMVQGFVEDRLVAPSTAEFPDAFDGYDYDENIDYEGNQTYYIRSWVDAQNSFGATIRTNFTARIQQVSEDQWELIELNIEDN